MAIIHWDTAAPPISFRYGDRPSGELLAAWNRSEKQEPAPGGVTRRITYADPVTGLEVTACVREFAEAPAREWVLELANAGAADTPIIADVRPLAVTLPMPRPSLVRLHHANGSRCRVDDFLPLTDVIHAERGLALAPQGGRSSNGVLPFMNLQLPGGGVVLAIGWSGQWSATLNRGPEALSFSAGMERTHLRLRPGERIRTPRILAVEWQGEDPAAGNNLLRRLILGHYTPHVDGGIAIPPIAHNTMSAYYRTHTVSEAAELDAIARCADLGLEAYWLDACWYGTGDGKLEWWQQVGDWRIRPDAFPNGLKPLGDAAHRAGMRFVLWFEPERVRPCTPIAAEHPEYLLRSKSDDLLLNLGLPEARAYIAEAILKVVEENGVDVYRQDFNMDPLPYWQAADAPDRIGMAEIRHIEGLYALWDELRTRAPRLTIDNCASGGRRIDLETIARSYPLWRSDFSDFWGPKHGRTLQIADQVATAGLSQWVPLHTGAVWTFSPYDFRSALAAGIVPYCDLGAADFPAAAAREAFAELRSLRPYLLGDWYPLLPVTAAAHDWCAYQCDRPDLAAGAALFLRRHESPFPVMEVALRGIDPQAAYDVSLSDTFAEASPVRMRGAELARLAISIPQAPGSILLRYRLVMEGPGQ